MRFNYCLLTPCLFSIAGVIFKLLKGMNLKTASERERIRSREKGWKMEKKRHGLLDLELGLEDRGTAGDFLSNLASVCHATLDKYPRKEIYNSKKIVKSEKCETDFVSSSF